MKSIESWFDWLATHPQKTMSRRDLLKGAGTAGALIIGGPLLGSLAACSPPATGNTTGATGINSALSPNCVLSPEQTEGPYYVEASKVRQDITEGKAGAAFHLTLTVINANTCQPIPNAIVDIWHADAEGLYSGYPNQGGRGRSIDTTGQTFLRGMQVSGSNGQTTFHSIYPGWYPGRTTHIHFKVHFNDNTRVTAQLHFPEDISTAIYTQQAAYKARGDKDTTNARDGIVSGTPNADRLLLNVQRQGDIYVANHTIGIAIN
jgi:protocatechuate 3,4-dioxygenase beta subunit